MPRYRYAVRFKDSDTIPDDPNVWLTPEALAKAVYDHINDMCSFEMLVDQVLCDGPKQDRILFRDRKFAHWVCRNLGPAYAVVVRVRT
jgi:hypothetical protein